jgi:microcystin-dependent protein
MSYFNNTIGTPLAFTGQIVAYVGTTDPDGWLICDGRLLSGFTDPKYNNLKTLLGGTNLPDLKSRNLFGSSTVGSTGGQSNISIGYNNLPDHSHSGITDTPGAHTHNWADNFYSDNRSASTNSNAGDGGGGNVAPSRTTNSSVYSGEHTVTNPTNYGVSSVTAISVVNPYYTVNWIIKY